MQALGVVPMRSAQPESGPCNVVSVPPWAALPLPTCGGETEAQGGNAPAAAELGHGRARPGPRPALLSLAGGVRGAK